MLRKELLEDGAWQVTEKAKKAALVAVPVVTSLAVPMTALAADTSSSPVGAMFDAISAGMQTAIQDMVTSVGSMVGGMIPVLFPLVALGIGISICIVMVRRVSNNA